MTLPTRDDLADALIQAFDAKAKELYALPAFEGELPNDQQLCVDDTYPYIGFRAALRVNGKTVYVEPSNFLRWRYEDDDLKALAQDIAECLDLDDTSEVERVMTQAGFTP